MNDIAIFSLKKIIDIEITMNPLNKRHMLITDDAKRKET